MYWLVSVTMLPPTLHPYLNVPLPQCHSENQMRLLKDCLRERLNIPDVKVELSYVDETGRKITVSDDDTVEEVVQAIVQVYLQTYLLLIGRESDSHRVGRVEITPPLKALIIISGYKPN